MQKPSRSTEHRSARSDFQNPPVQYRAVSFWSLNGELRAAELRRQIDVFKEMGLGGVCLHSRSGLRTRYLSSQWFNAMRVCVEHARKRGMLIWLYDEDRFPSGAAGGLVTKDPRFRQCRLWMEEVPRGRRPSRPDPLAVFALQGTVDRPRGCRRVEDTPSLRPDEKLLAFHIQTSPLNTWYNGYTYLDTMSKDAVEAFLASTYEPYRKRFKRDFGKTIEAIFTDEPNRGPHLMPFWGDFIEGYADVELREIPWTPRLQATFSKRFGYAVEDHLPDLFIDTGGNPETTRSHYFELTTDLLATSFCRTVFQWCRREGIELAGHMQGEELPGMQTALIGAAMRHFPYFDMPGIDVLGADNCDYEAAVQCTSVANQAGRKWVMSETYGGAQGWDLSFATQKALGDWQTALGVNRRCLHLGHYTLEGDAKRDYPPSISFHEAWWPHYRMLEDYHARATQLMTRGKPVRDALMINPTESMWLQAKTGWMASDEAKRIDASFQKISRALLFRQVSFDFGDEATLGAQAKIRDGQLVVGKMKYARIVVPPMHTIRSSTLGLLADWMLQGGDVLWAGPLPRRVDAEKSDRATNLAARARRFTSAAALAACLRESATVRIEGRGCRRLLHQLRDEPSRSLLFVANTAESPCHCDVHVTHRSGEVQTCDAQTGRVSNLECKAFGAGTSFAIDLPAHGSGLYVIGARIGKGEDAPPLGRTARTIALPERWDYSLAEPNPLVLDQVRIRRPGRSWSPMNEVLVADRSLREELGIPPRRYHDMQPWAMKKDRTPARRVEVRYFFKARTLPAEGPIQLALEHGEGLRELRLNGHKLRLERDEDWWLDPSLRCHALNRRHLKTGQNEITLSIDYTVRFNLENMFLLSASGVRATGVPATLVPARKKLSVGDVTSQDLAFYGAGIRYTCRIQPKPRKGERVILRLGDWSGACAAVCLDKQPVGTIGFPPYEMELPVLDDREHLLGIEVIPGRGNTLGPLHMKRGSAMANPFDWQPQGTDYVKSYCLQAVGLLEAPRLVMKAPTAPK